MKEYGTIELTAMINNLVDFYSLPKKVSADYENIFIETRFIEEFRCFSHMQGRPFVSINQVIPYLSKLDGFDKETLVTTRGLPDVLYRMFVSEETYMIGFQALLAVQLKEDEWQGIYHHLQGFSEDDYSCRREFRAFSASLSCPVSILKQFSDCIENKRSTTCLSGHKYYWRYVVEAREQLNKNLQERSETRDSDLIPPPSKAAIISSLSEDRLSEAQLHEYVYSYLDVDRLIAQSQIASQRTLSLLAKSSDKKTRRYVAENINTRNEDWINLCGEFPTILKDGPNLMIRLLEKPNILQALPRNVCLLLAASHKTPEQLLLKLSKHQHSEIATRAKSQLMDIHERSKSEPKSASSASLHDVEATTIPHSPLEIDALFEEKVKSRLGTRIYSNGSKDSARHAWEKKYIGPEQFAHLHLSSKLDIVFRNEDQHYEVCTALIRKGRIDESRSARMLKMVMAGNSRCLWELLSSDKIGSAEVQKPIEAMLEQEIYYDEWSQLHAIAENKNTSADQLDKLAFSKHELVRLEVAKHSSTTLDTLSILENEGGVVGDAAATNRRRRKRSREAPSVKQSYFNIDENLLYQLQAKVSCLSTIICSAGVDSTNDDSMAYSSLSEADINELKRLYSEHKKFLDKLEPMLRNGKEYGSLGFVEKFVAKKDCPELIMALICSIDSRFRGRCELYYVLIRIAEKRKISATVHAFLADRLWDFEQSRVEAVNSAESCAVVQRRVKKRTQTAGHAVRIDSVLYVENGADNASSRHPLGVLLALCSEDSIETRLLDRLAKSKDYLVRAAVARNPFISEGTRRALTRDPHPFVVSVASTAMVRANL